MSYLLRIAWPILLLLVALALPFLLFGKDMERWAAEWRANPPGPGATFGIVVGLLATDILLPTPSSVISTVAGGQLGWLGGALASWLGMTLGAGLGFALARRWGPSFARRMSSPEDLRRMELASGRFGPGILVLARGVPLLAEASVLLVGMHGMPWRRFLPPVLLSNLGIAAAYGYFGNVAEQNQWLPLALGISVGLPVLLAMAGRWWLPRQA